MDKLTRRQFLQAGAAGAAGVLLGDGMRLCLSASQAQEWAPTLARLGEPIPTTCGMCPAGCGLLCYLDGDELKGIFGHPAHPVNRGKICARGIAGLNAVFDPDRILYPMKRIGKRGEGQWKRMTWDEGYQTIASELASLNKGDRMGDAVFDVNREERLVTRFLDALNGPTVLDRSKTGQWNKRIGHEVTWGAEYGVVDPSKSAFILNFGSNPYESGPFHIGLAQRLVEGRIDHGAKLVTFDVRLSNTAAQSDEAFLIKPGTDGIIALAMANVIMNEGLHAVEFLHEWTNYPVQRLAAHLGPYPPERAAYESGMSAADIRRIAIEYARSKPAAVLSGGGVSEHLNGLQNERCLLLLTALAGNIDVEGGNCLPRMLPLTEPDPVVPPRTENIEHTQQPSSLLGLLDQRKGIDVYLTAFSNPVYDDPEGERTAEALKNEKEVPLYVAFDTHVTESSALADMILPAATYLESWGVYAPPSMDMRPIIHLRQPVVKRVAETQFLKAGEKMSSAPFQPLGESRSLGDVCLEIAHRMGDTMAYSLPFPSTQAYIYKLISGIEGLMDRGGMAHLQKHGFWVDSSKEVEYTMYKQRGFDTPSGKFEIRSTTLERMNITHLPVYKAISTQVNLGDQECMLTTYTLNVHTNRTGNCKWLSEIMHDNPAWINSETAESLGIRSGDRIRITSRVGEIVTRVFLTEGIHPKTVAIAQGCGHWEWGRFARAEKGRGHDADRRLIWWGKIGNGVHPNPIIPVATDPSGGGQAWHDTRVTISKV